MKTKSDKTCDIAAANEAFEKRRDAGDSVTIGEIEVEFGLRPKQLKNWRDNRKKLERVATAARREAVGEAPSNSVGVPPEASLLPVDAAIRLIDVGDTENDPDNSRTRMDEGKLEELALSIRRNGVQHNCSVVWNPESKKWRLIVGNRRGIAAARAVARLREDVKVFERGLPTAALLLEGERAEDLPAMLERARLVPCRVLSGVEAVRLKELQLTENLRREDLDEIDEARGYDWLVRHGGQSVAQVALAVGCSEEHIRQRRKLMRVPESMVAALREGRIGTRVCEHVASIPGEIDREVCAGMILKPKHSTQPLSEREVVDLIGREFKKSLRQVPWDLKDAELLPDAGSCQECAFRTGNMVELAADVAPGKGQSGVCALTCTKPECFRAKTRAAAERAREAAEAAGAVVLSPVEGDRIFAGPGGATAFDSRFARLDDVLTAKETGHHDASKSPKWRDVMEKAGIEAPKLVVIAPDGVAVPVVERASMREALHEALSEQGKVSPFANGHSPGDDRRDKQKKNRDAKKGVEKAGLSLLERVMTAVFDLGEGERLNLLVLMLLGVVVEEDEDAQYCLKRILGVEGDLGIGETVADQIVDFVAAADRTAPQMVSYLAGAILAPGARWQAGQCPHVKAFAEYLGVKVGEGSGNGDRGSGKTEGKLWNLETRQFGERGADGWHVVNKHGVFDEPDVVPIFTKKDKRHSLAICLAETGEGWFAARQYERHNASGGGLPSPRWGVYESREMALLGELEEAGRCFEKSGNSNVSDAPKWVSEAIAGAISEMKSLLGIVDGDEQGDLFGEG